MDAFYSSHSWRTVRARALARDDRRCTVSRLLGGPSSSGPLHAHHIIPRSEMPSLALDIDNVGTSCARHHGTWEHLRRLLVRRRVPPAPRCPHAHRSVEARRLCEARLARQRSAA